jgi:Crp-like helix-turn-helix domain
MGLTPVHVSRVVSQFHKSRIINISERRIEILDMAELKHIAALK